MPLPKTRDGLIALLVGAALAGLTTYKHSVTPTPLWALIAHDVLAFVALGLGVAFTANGKRAGGAAVAALLAFGLAAGSSGCASPYRAAWGTLDAVQQAQRLTAQTLAHAAKVKHKDCVAQHGAKTPGYAGCIKGHRDALRVWRTRVRPALNAAVELAVGALRVSEAAGRKKPPGILVYIRTAVCALLGAVRDASELFPDKGEAVLSALGGLQGVICGNN